MRYFFVLPLILVLAGCATATRYAPAQNGSEGYSETNIQEGVFGVQFKGRSDTSVQTMTDFALLRCAELTLKNGYRYFAVVSEQAEIKPHSYTIPQPPRQECFGRYCFDYGPNWRTYIYPMPSAYLLIQCYKEKPANQPSTIFDAAEIKKNLEIQYRLASPAPQVQAEAPHA